MQCPGLTQSTKVSRPSSVARHELRHLDGIEYLLVGGLQLFSLQERWNRLWVALHGVQAHSFPEPTLWVARVNLCALGRI